MRPKKKNFDDSTRQWNKETHFESWFTILIVAVFVSVDLRHCCLEPSHMWHTHHETLFTSSKQIWDKKESASFFSQYREKCAYDGGFCRLKNGIKTIQFWLIDYHFFSLHTENFEILTRESEMYSKVFLLFIVALGVANVSI